MSVIIPTYKHEAFVLTTLASVFAQTFADFEVIVVNDGSPDGTAELLRPLSLEGRIRYFEQPNAGQAAARNRGLKAARGEYVAFLDDDDLWPPTSLELRVGALTLHRDAAASAGSANYINATGEQIGQLPVTRDRIDFESLFSGCPFVSPGQVLFRKAAVQDVGGFDERIWGADDFDLYFKVARAGEIVGLPDPVLTYRWHCGNASNDLSRMLRNCTMVFETHLHRVEPDRRRLLARTANRYLYSFLGGRIVQRARQRLVAGDLWSFLRLLGSVLFLLRNSLGDRVVWATLLRDFFRIPHLSFVGNNRI